MSPIYNAAGGRIRGGGRKRKKKKRRKKRKREKEKEKEKGEGKMLTGRAAIPRSGGGGLCVREVKGRGRRMSTNEAARKGTGRVWRMHSGARLAG